MNVRGKLGVMRHMSVLLQRLNLAGRAGLQFGGDRDLYAVYGYKQTLRYEDFLIKYLRQDVAKRIINAPGFALWQNPPEITGVDGWDDFAKEWDVWNTFQRLDKLASIGQYAVLLLGLDGTSQNNVGNRSNLTFMQPYSQVAATIVTFEEDETNPRFGQPKTYEITIADPADLAVISQASKRGALTRTIKVDYTRIVHVVEDPLEDNVFGVPRLMPIYNLLEDLLKTAGGAAEMFWLSGRQGLHLDVDPEMDLDEDDAKDLSDEAEEYSHQLRRILRTRGVDVKALGADVIDPRGTFQVIISLLSGATGMPQRILLGSEAGQLASEQDRANWAERIDERRGSFGEPQVIRPFIKTLQGAGILGEGIPEIKWPSAFKLSPLEEAQTSAQKARSVVNLSRQGQYGNITSREEAREIVGLPGKFPAGGTEVGSGDEDDQSDRPGPRGQGTANNPEDGNTVPSQERS